MKNIEKTIKFLIKNWMIAIPTVIGCVIISIVYGIFQILHFFTSLELTPSGPIDDFLSYESYLQGIIPEMFPVFVMVFVLAIVSVIITFLYFPVMAGLVHESIRNNRIINKKELYIASKEAFLNNIKKYFKFFVANFLINLSIFIIIAAIVSIALLIGFQGIPALEEYNLAFVFLLLFVLIIVIGALVIVFCAFSSMWFQAIIIDKLKVFEALKVCFDILKRRFWYLMGMFLFVTLINLVISSSISIFTIIPLLGWIVTGTATGFFVMFNFVFYMYMYYENRPNLDLINNKQIEYNEGIQY